jgi:hypothetical protein
MVIHCDKELVFRGFITSGKGTFVELHVPGRAELAHAPPDWPEVLEKGSLNVEVAADGYPRLFTALGLSNSTKSLDQRPFPAAFEIAQQLLGNNKLVPTQAMPHQGSAQVWRVILCADTEDHSCWVLRRYGSGLHDQLELLSHVKLRDALKLQNNQAVKVVFQPSSCGVEPT